MIFTMNYKDTLNLPQTDFPMKANLPEREPSLLAFWDSIQLYQKMQNTRENAPVYVLHDGPPYANGNIHIGHAMNKILKDMVLKSKHLSGFKTPYVPGWDCHGLPIELNVEKKIGKVGEKVSAKEFRQACRDYALEQIENQKNQFIRLGIPGDWNNPYLTLKPSYEANIVRALAKIIENGYLVRGQKPVHWCPLCNSALAEAEVEYQSKTSPAIDVAFYALEPEKVGSLFKHTIDAPLFIPIWTTTPWTLPANQAVAVNPELEYVLVKAMLHKKLQYFVVAQALLESVLQRYAPESFETFSAVKGMQLENIRLQHPFLDRIVPVVLGLHVTTETGTGGVHTAPAHGLDDYLVALEYKLAVDNPVDAKSLFKTGTPIVEGHHVYKANEPILNVLEKSGHLLRQLPLQHSYPHCWRHKTPLIFRATSQWFIAMGRNERHLATGNVHEITAEVRGSLENISNNKLLRDLALQAIKNVHWYDVDPKTLLGEEANHYEKIMDILDVWFDSGVSHYCVLEKRPELHEPADLYLEGSDQHRGWFQTSLLTAVAMRERAPYKNVLTHGFVVDSKGHKMSKSLGNVVSPEDVIKKLGVDILRLWVSSCDHSKEATVSDEILNRTADAYRRLRNTMRFLLSNVVDFEWERDAVSPNDMADLDRWAIQFTQSTQEQVKHLYETFRFQQLYQLIHNFCAEDMGGFYLDVIKDRLYTAKKDSKARRSAQTALYVILHALVRWVAPILSFTAEEVWKHMPGNKAESVFLTQWFDQWPAVEVTIDWEIFRQVRNESNKFLEQLRQQGDIGSGLEANVILYVDDMLYKKL